MEILVCNKELKTYATERRLHNIKAFASLDRPSHLSFEGIERLLHIKTTSNEEKIYIRYPGKEAAREKGKRPLDFKPVMQYEDGSWCKFLSFGDIWDDISELRDVGSCVTADMAFLFFKMAYMVDYELKTKTLKYFDVDLKTNEVVGEGNVDLEYYAPVIDDFVTELSKSIGQIRNMSLEAYVLYNELLVQNEDCKYYYQDVVEDGKAWDSNKGRRNTLFSHLTVISYLQKIIGFSEVMMRFQRGRGVAPITLGELEMVTGGKVVKG